ncbi:hypothetical protein SEA_MAZUN_6 [Microbacterium phage Mazun]|nr:hypothetical protein SEA_MAZUN_6 [Microbacterium phage Mazun]
MPENIHAEERHCFKTEAHKPHNWEAGEKDFRCLGQGVDPESQKVRPISGGILPEQGAKDWERAVHESNRVTFDPPIPFPEQEVANTELAHRPEYGDPLQNMIDQAALFNAYLSGREIQPIDVPILFLLTKVHRLGKTPDYKDNYDDIKGYLRLAEGLVGEDMIDAATTREYTAKKEERERRVRKPEGSGNPYRNVPGA